MGKGNKLIINELRIKNVGPLKEIQVVPKGDFVELTGPNGAGKSTVLDAISYALGGARTFSDIPNVVRNGEDEAEVIIDLGEYRVIREWAGNENYKLKVMAKLGDGSETPMTAPQSVLDAFGETIGVDPLALSQKQNTDMRKSFLERFVDVDLDRLEHEKKQVYEKRTEVNRDAKKAKARKEGLEPKPKDLPERVDVSQESERLQEAQAKNNKIERAEERRDELVDNMGHAKNRVKKLEKKLKAAKKTAKEAEKEVSKAEEWLDNHEAVDLDPIKEKISKAEKISEMHRLAKQHEQLDEEIKQAEKESSQLTDELEEFDKKKVEAIQSAKMPIDGLNIEDSDVTVDGQPFLQYSEGERLRLAALMLVGSNPRFKVIGIKEGEKLDSKNMGIIQDVCKEHGFQLWVEKMDETGDVGFVFNEGEIIKNNEK